VELWNCGVVELKNALISHFFERFLPFFKSTLKIIRFFLQKKGRSVFTLQSFLSKKTQKSISVPTPNANTALNKFQNSKNKFQI
jgi:hypothetical protein